MKQTVTGKIIYHNKMRCFGDGEGGFVDELVGAAIYPTESKKEDILEYFDDDQLDYLEIWDIRVIYNTIRPDGEE